MLSTLKPTRLVADDYARRIDQYLYDTGKKLDSVAVRSSR